MARKQSTPKPTRTDADRRVRQADRLGRVLRILELIQGHGRWDASNLAAELECSARTVHRYLDVLKYAGVPFWFDKEQSCYRVRPDFRFPALNLNEDELLGQSLAGSVSANKGLGVGRGGQVTTEKLSAVSDAKARALLEQAGQLVSVLDLKLVDHSQHQETIRTIQWALLKSRQLAGKYQSPYAEHPKRVTLHPYRLCLVRHAWYVIARPGDQDEPRPYRVNRFKTLQLLDAAADVPADFDLHAFLGNAWGIFRGDTTYDIEIHFVAEAAMQVTETRWHHTQQVKRHRDGSVTLTFRVDGLNEIIWWLLGWSGFAKVIRPEELRLRLLEQLEAGIGMNRDMGRSNKTGGTNVA